MKNLNTLDGYRIPFMGDMGDSKNGAFTIKIEGKPYMIMASSGGDWEHVSVSNKSQVPPWSVMCEIRELFFTGDEAVMQLHPKKIRIYKQS